MADEPDLRKILSVLSDRSTLRIFNEASKGLKSEKFALAESNLSRKQFYVKLQGLIGLGLITESAGVYCHSELGALVYGSNIKTLAEVLANHWNSQEANEPKYSKIITTQERERVINALVAVTGSKDYFASYKKIASVRVIGSYPKLVEALLNIIELAKKQIWIASRYYEPVISSKLVEKFAQGVSLSILDGNSSGISLSERISEAARVDTRKKELLSKFLDSPNVKIVSANLEYSFVVIDEMYCGLELLNPRNPNEFDLGILFEDEEISAAHIEKFEHIMTEESSKVDLNLRNDQ